MLKNNLKYSANYIHTVSTDGNHSSTVGNHWQMGYQFVINIDHLSYKFLQTDVFFCTVYVVGTTKVQNQNSVSTVENTIKLWLG